MLTSRLYMYYFVSKKRITMLVVGKVRVTIQLHIFSRSPLHWKGIARTFSQITKIKCVDSEEKLMGLLLLLTS